MDPEIYFKKPVNRLASKLMREKHISRKQAVKLIWNDLILISKYVDQNFPELNKEEKLYEIGGRFDAFLKGEYNSQNG